MNNAVGSGWASGRRCRLGVGLSVIIGCRLGVGLSGVGLSGIGLGVLVCW